MFFQYSLIILLKFILDFRRDATQEFCQDGEVSTAWPVCMLIQEGHRSFWVQMKTVLNKGPFGEHSDGKSTKIRTQFGMLFHISVELCYR